MAQEIINIGATPNDGTGDTLRNSFQKTNSNFTELYSDKENVANKATNLTSPDNTKYPTTLAVSTALSGKQDTLTNPITGTGTTNYLPKFTGSGTLGNSQIFDNGTNVGIGTTSPGARLDIRAQGALSTNIAFRVRNSADNNDLIRVQGDGNVGIGTTSPLSRLHVVSSLAPQLRIDSTASNVNVEQRMMVNGSTILSMGVDTADFNKFKMVYSTQLTGSSNGIILTSTGNVGIATTAPTSKLHVVGLPSYADNATAIAGGLTVGAFYHTGGILKVVI